MKGIVSYLPEHTAIPFMRRRMIGFIISALLIVLGTGDMLLQGLNLGIDFRGGILLEIKTPEPADLSQMRRDISNLDLGEINLQEFGADDVVLIRIQRQEGEEDAQAAAIDRVKEALGSEIEIRRQEFVGPQVGRELIKAGLLSILFSLGGIMIYIWFRFEWQFAVAAVLALLHDTIATVALFSLTQMEFNLSTVAAVLMIAGYSINDTVVVFDRMRENLRKYKRESLITIIDRSLNETLTRTLLTSGTTLVALAALWIFGGEVIRGFTIALIWGIAVGTYSSIFIAAPMLIFLKLRPEQLSRVSGEKADSDGTVAQS
ncbi:MAG TPA: protein translocase subunit SecF [Rhodospirillaceae bacterium]|nr:protein translocase subunit SecF [Alphaproteobacteria bacterium]MAS45958.1 protein translocase subunit SecF [Alphaproteobacteria bacterium]MAX95860.1 protein translocase subunit SecF [Alphaproteobacteria bacterium]MBN53066.1 protein translocase subunit SecF [Alphaproteobacteria bacterium]HCI47332.1 protein translocase subunit SecF [Rhodospirillaceae bacterium]|tara:strand:+ start:13808 stop:14761 length:954 start_codon:yes stop_codon:yes gene_type:complete